MKTTVGTLSVLAILLTGTTQVQADVAGACTYDDPTYTCDNPLGGDGPPTGGGGDVDDQTVNITSTGVIDTSVDGVNLNDDNTITNDGTIKVSKDGMKVGSGNTVTNSASGTIEADRKGIQAGNSNIITNNGSVTTTGVFSGNQPAIDVGNLNTITNTGLITADHVGMEVRDGNTITNSATGAIDAGDRGINARDGNTIVNDGSIVVGKDGIEVRNGNTITNSASGTIVADRRGIHANDNNIITNNGSVNSTGDFLGIYATVDMRDGNTFTNNGSITNSEDKGNEGINMRTGNTVTNNGSIVSRRAGIEANGASTIINNGLIQSTTRQAVLLSPDADFLTNNGKLIGGDGGTAVKMGGGDDTFTWQALSQVTGEVLMGIEDTADTLIVEAADVFGSTTFRSLEIYDIAAGSAAVLEDLGGDDYILHTGSPTTLATAGTMVGGLAHGLTGRLLHGQGGSTQGGQVTKGVQVTQATQGSGGAGSWWGMIGASSQNDSGQGFEQDSQNITIGKSMGQFDVFVGYESASADMTIGTDSSDQDMFYIGASKVFQLNPNMDFMGVALIGGTSTDYSTTGGSMDGDGFFYSFSGGLSYHQSGFVVGTYLGYAVLDTDAMSTGTIAFASQSSDAVFGGIDISFPKYDIGGGTELNAVFGYGFQNGAADAVSMSAGGGSTTVAGTDTNQDFGMVGFDLSNGSVTGSMRLRAVGGASSTLDVWVHAKF